VKSLPAYDIMTGSRQVKTIRDDASVGLQCQHGHHQRVPVT